jgi:crotonobetainyl-CoA:carnitine CoA-transferase CaiB-like acyl-CoA transferase
MCGSLTAFAGVLMALVRQRATGLGDCLDIAMHDSLLAWTAHYQGPIFAARQAHDVKFERNWGGAAFYRHYETRDGKWIVLGGIELHFCENFLHKAGRLDLLDLCRQPPGRAQQPVVEFLRGFFAARSQEEALEWLADVDCCHAPLRTLLEGTLDPNTRERDMLLTDPQGHDHLGVPIKFTREPGQVNFAVPGLGEHGAAMLHELGYAADEIATLERDRVI